MNRTLLVYNKLANIFSEESKKTLTMQTINESIESVISDEFGEMLPFIKKPFISLNLKREAPLVMIDEDEVLVAVKNLLMYYSVFFSSDEYTMNILGNGPMFDMIAHKEIDYCDLDLKEFAKEFKATSAPRIKYMQHLVFTAASAGLALYMQIKNEDVEGVNLRAVYSVYQLDLEDGFEGYKDYINLSLQHNSPRIKLATFLDLSSILLESKPFDKGIQHAQNKVRALLTYRVDSLDSID